MRLSSVRMRARASPGSDSSGRLSPVVNSPRSVQPDEVVRVRLIPIEGKTDKNGRVMYRAEFAPLDVPMDIKEAIAVEARELRKNQALPREQGEAILRAKGVAGAASHGWYYFCEDEVFGSHLSPAALTALELMPSASGGGLVELIAWVVENGYYSAIQERGEARTPEIPENALADLKERMSRNERMLSVSIQ